MALGDKEKNYLSVALNEQNYETMIDMEKLHIDDKNEFVSTSRYLNLQKHELASDPDITQAKVHFLRERQHEQESEFARELNEIKRKEMNDKLLRQHLRENAHELRELELKLKSAYCAKGVAAQIADKKAREIDQKIKQKREFEFLQTAWTQEQEIQRIRAEKQIVKKAKYKQELQDQMILKEKTKRHLYDEFLKEKKMIDDVIQRIHEEDQREIEEKMCKMHKTREEMNKFKEAQEMWRRKKHEELDQENIKIQEYLMTKASHLQAGLEEKQRKEAAKEQLSEKIAKEMYEQLSKQKERDAILQDLLEEEQKEAIKRKHREEIEKQIRQRLDIRQSLNQQMHERHEKMRQEAEEDSKYKQELMDKMAEDHRVEQMSAQKRRMKMLQFRRDIEQMLVDRRQKRAEEMQMLMKMREGDEQKLAARKQILEEERLQILKEHAKNLIGFLPKGLLKPSDLPHLGL